LTSPQLGQTSSKIPITNQTLKYSVPLPKIWHRKIRAQVKVPTNLGLFPSRIRRYTMKV
jgi:hypothetical protein